jgi:hypothetical protein
MSVVFSHSVSDGTEESKDELIATPERDIQVVRTYYASVNAIQVDAGVCVA